MGGLSREFLKKSAKKLSKSQVYNYFSKCKMINIILTKISVKINNPKNIYGFLDSSSDFLSGKNIKLALILRIPSTKYYSTKKSDLKISNSSLIRKNFNNINLFCFPKTLKKQKTFHSNSISLKINKWLNSKKMVRIFN